MSMFLFCLEGLGVFVRPFHVKSRAPIFKISRVLAPGVLHEQQCLTEML